MKVAFQGALTGSLEIARDYHPHPPIHRERFHANIRQATIAIADEPRYVAPTGCVYAQLTPIDNQGDRYVKSPKCL